jgi:hypothetical protein
LRSGQRGRDGEPGSGEHAPLGIGIGMGLGIGMTMELPPGGSFEPDPGTNRLPLHDIKTAF